MIDAIQGQSQINNPLPSILQSIPGGSSIANSVANTNKSSAAKTNDKVNNAKASIAKASIDKIDIKNTEEPKPKTEAPKVNYNELSDKLKTIIDSQDLLIEFSRDEATKKMILKIIDFDTREVIQQFPPEVTLRIARFVSSTLNTGNLTNAKV